MEPNFNIGDPGEYHYLRHALNVQVSTPEITREQIAQVCAGAQNELEFILVEGLDCQTLARELAGKPIKRLLVHFCELDDEHLRMLAPAFPLMPNLDSLNLEGNLLTNVGMEILANVITQCALLRDLNVSTQEGDHITEEGIKKILAAFKSRKTDIQYYVSADRNVRLQLSREFLRTEYFFPNDLRNSLPQVLSVLTYGKSHAERFFYCDGDHAMLHRVIWFLAG